MPRNKNPPPPPPSKSRIRQFIDNIRAERQRNIEVRRQAQAEYEKGYIKGMHQRGILEGSGKTPKPQYGPSKPHRVGKLPIFSGDPIGFGFDIFGSPSKTKPAAPTRITKVSPTGKVTIQEYQQPKQKEDDYSDFYSITYDFGDTDKKRKHPYDIF